MNLDEEIQYQLDMLAKGLKPSEVLVANDTDNDAIVNTAAVVDQDRKDNVKIRNHRRKRTIQVFSTCGLLAKKARWFRQRDSTQHSHPCW